MIFNKFKVFVLFSTLVIYGVNATKSEKLTNINLVNVLMPAPFADSTSQLVKRFNRDNESNIKVVVTRGPMETEAVSDLAISNLMLGKSQYDALLIDITWLPKYAASNWLEPLNKYFNKDRWNSLTKGAKKGNTYKGEVYRWPFVADMGLLYWRKDLIKSPPRTPKELEYISRKLIRDNAVKYGYVWQGRQYEGLSCVFLEILHGYGGSWIDSNGDVKLNTVNSVKAVTWLLNLIEEGISPKAVTNFAENESLQVFKSGDAAFMRNWPYAWSELQKDDSKVRNKVGVTTMVSLKDKQSTATLGSWGFSILKDSRNKENTFKVIEYLTSNMAQRELFIKYGYTPITKTLYENKSLVKQYPILNSLSEGLKISKPRPKTPFYAQISDVLQRQLSSILTKELEPFEAMNQAQYQTEKILRSTEIKK